MLRFLCFVAAAALSGASWAATPTIGSPSTEPRPLLIVTSETANFALEGRFEGTYSVQGGFIEVSLTRSSILLLGSATAQQPRLLTTIRLGLAHNTTTGQWQPSDYVTVATPNKMMAVGEMLQLPPATIRIPIRDARLLPRQWFVVEMANTLSNSSTPNGMSSGVCYAHSGKEIFTNRDIAIATPASARVSASATPLPSAGPPSNQPRPFVIVSNESDNFALAGRFEGTYSVHPGFVEVNVTRASILLLGHPNYQGPRLVSTVRLSLARLTNGRWGSVDYVTLATPNKILKVGETLPLAPTTIRIPCTDASKLPQHWFVAEMTYLLADPAKPSSPKASTCYAHSPRTVFASGG